jgi:hypothetical protein
MAALAVASGLAPSSASAATLVKTIGFPGPAGLYAYGMDWDKSDNTILVADSWTYRVKRYSATRRPRRFGSPTRETRASSSSRTTAPSCAASVAAGTAPAGTTSRPGAEAVT